MNKKPCMRNCYKLFCKFFLTAYFIIAFIPAWAQYAEFSFVKQLGGNSDVIGNSLAVDASGNIYITGNFNGTADFDPGPGIENLTSAGNSDVFVCKLDASGNFVWVKQLGGALNDFAFSIAVDVSGNIYTTGRFEGTADFDPGSGIANFTSAGSSDIFISKLDASGNFLWAKQLGGTLEDMGNFLVLDKKGNVYTTGYFQGTVDFDPGTGTATLISSGSVDVFISKLDASGNFVWAKQLGGTLIDYGFSIAADTSGNLYITGAFQGTADFDPGPGTENLTSRGGFDIFISKLDALGNFVWVKQLGGAQDDFGFSIGLDKSGNVYTTGDFLGISDFDPGTGSATLTSTGSSDVFISKLDNAGNFVWAKQLGGILGDMGNSVALDTSGNIYTTGYFHGIADFDPGPSTSILTSQTGDAFISKLDSLGNFVWAKQLRGVDGSSSDNGYSLVVDSSESIYLTGYFLGTVDFDPGTADTYLTSLGNQNAYIQKMTTSGALPVTWLHVYGHCNSQRQAVVIWSVQEAHVLNYIIEKSVDGIHFKNIGSITGKGNGENSYEFTDRATSLATAYYRIRQTDIDGNYSYSVVLKISNNNVSPIKVYPVPAQNSFTIQIGEDNLLHTQVELMDISGKLLKAFTIKDYSTRVDVSALAGGVYILKFADGSKTNISVKK